MHYIFQYSHFCFDSSYFKITQLFNIIAECKARVEPFADDGLDALIDALSPVFTSRFGEICWAQGGVGFGWWVSTRSSFQGDW